MDSHLDTQSLALGPLSRVGSVGVSIVLGIVGFLSTSVVVFTTTLKPVSQLLLGFGTY